MGGDNNLVAASSLPLPMSDIASQLLDKNYENQATTTTTNSSSIVKLIKHDTNNNSITKSSSSTSSLIKKNSNTSKKSFAQKYLRSTSRLVRSTSGSSMDLLSNLRLTTSNTNKENDKSKEKTPPSTASSSSSEEFVNINLPITNKTTTTGSMKSITKPPVHNNSSSISISKSNSLVNMLNFGKNKARRAQIFNKLNSSDHNLSLQPQSHSQQQTPSSSYLNSKNALNMSSVSSFGTVKIKDKKFFNILSSRPKFLDTPKPQQQQIMPPPSSSSTSYAKAHNSSLLLMPSFNEQNSHGQVMVSVDLNGNNIKNKASSTTAIATTTQQQQHQEKGFSSSYTASNSNGSLNKVSNG